MKVPKTLKRYCPYCKKHSEHKIEFVSSGHNRGSLRRGAIVRAQKRGLGVGRGNLGKWGSKPAAASWKRKTKSTKKTNMIYTCSVCKKSSIQRKGKRVGKVTFTQQGGKLASAQQQH